jgi:hypothetical protein
MNPDKAGADRVPPGRLGDTAMKIGKTFLVLALLMAAIGSHQAQAGMSGTSARVQQISNSEAQAAIHAPPPAARPQVQAPRRQPQQQQQRPVGGNFDGVWAVSSSPGCGLDERSAVEVRNGRVIAPGLSGSVDAKGNVRTVFHGGGVSIISTGRSGPTQGSGTYTVSNGCTGTWTSQKA